MMKRLSNLLHRDRTPRAVAEPAVVPVPQPAANRAARPRERDRNRHAALQPAAAHLPARAASPRPRSPERLAEAMARIDLAQHGSPPRVAAAVNEPQPQPQLQAPPAFDLKLSDLRMHRNETDHNLVFAYPIPSGPYEPVALAVDAASAGLQGRAYLEFLLADPRTQPEMTELVGHKLLSKTKPIPEERLNDIAPRLRAIMAEAYLSDDLMGEIEVIANEAIPHCKDRTDVALGQMEDAALHARLVRGAVTDETTLYNYGVSFFMLNAVREETRDLLKQRLAEGQIPRQEVHDIQNARYFLQETLHLPHRLQQPIVPNAMYGIVTQQIAEEYLLPRVTARALQHNGQNVMQFISNWQPWRRHLNERWPAMQEMSASFHRRLERTMELREVPDSPIARLSEVRYQEKIDQLRADKIRVESELADQLALELLFNRRGEYLVEHNLLTPYFS